MVFTLQQGGDISLTTERSEGTESEEKSFFAKQHSTKAAK